MTDAVVHLLFVLSGVAAALGALCYFAKIRGGFASVGGLFTITLLVVSAVLILMGFGVIGLPVGGVS